MNTKVHFYYKLIEEMNEWSPEEVREWQNKKLQELIVHFYNNTAYYKRVFDEKGLKPTDINSREDLIKIPSINKDIIRKHYKELLPNNLNSIAHKQANTGGSSGKTLQYLLDLRAWSYTTAVKIYSWQTTGYLYGDRFAAIGSSSLFPEKPSLKHRLFYLFKSTIPLSAMNLSSEKIAQHLSVIRDKKIEYLYGYASALYLIAKYMNMNNIRIDSVKACFPTSEVLTKEYRNEIEKAFGKVMDGYGARDSSITAYEINSGYYNVSYNSIAEVVDCYEKDTGKLLVTDLLNYAFPFIRYDLDDDVTLPNDTSSFDYNGQVMTKILGRSPDIIRLKNGNILTGPAFQMLFGRYNVSAYRIVRTENDNLSIEVQPTEHFSKNEEREIIDMFKKQAGEGCEITLKLVEEFVPSKNGKRNYFIA